MTRLVAILGPTATGKTAVALDIARRVGGVIISVDSMQVYRGMDIGTAKPSPAERRQIPHFMIDLVDPIHDFSVAEFRRHAHRTLDDLDAGVALIVGGSGLHFRAVVDPMVFGPTNPAVRQELETTDLSDLVAELTAADPEAGAVVDLSNRRRVMRSVETLRLSGETPSLLAQGTARSRYSRYQAERPFEGYLLDRPDVGERVHDRLAAMRAAGLLEEVAGLAGRLGRTASQAVGYRQLLPVVAGRASVDQGFADAERATMRLVKRQRTFFRRDPRLHPLDAGRPGLAEAILERTGL